jgi:hypothetical protein
VYWLQEKHSTSFTVWHYRCLRDENSFFKWKLPVNNHRGGLREIEIKLNPPSRGKGLKIPIRPNIFISPPRRRVTVACRPRTDRSSLWNSLTNNPFLVYRIHIPTFIQADKNLIIYFLSKIVPIKLNSQRYMNKKANNILSGGMAMCYE